MTQPKINRLFLMVFMGVLTLVGCQMTEPYANSDLRISFEHPAYWEMIEESQTKVLFQAKHKKDGDVSILLQRYDDVQNSLDSQTILEMQVDELLRNGNITLLDEIHFTVYDHPDYDIVIAQSTDAYTFVGNIRFSVHFHEIVIRDAENIILVSILGDGLEPAKASDLIVNSLEFVP